jgi:pimeloyl-ACP methyl ester carboxylesterase
VLVFDRQGHGQSSAVSMDPTQPIHYPRTSQYLSEHALIELPAVLHQAQQALDLAGPPILYGHSDGGTIALMYASEHPCAAVIAEAPHVFAEPDLMYPGVDSGPWLCRPHSSKTTACKRLGLALSDREIFPLRKHAC